VKHPTDSTPIRYKFLNMDGQCRVATERELLDYAVACPGGTHRALPVGFGASPVLMAYGVKGYGFADMIELDMRLPKL
jgi:hypothetical protein